jgi:L,D-peptidoglycan transpeptidase YkuD (ErfK/YbiS/YcfS/YnhG family)
MRATLHPDGRFTLGGQVLRAALGRSGVSTEKHEGDGATPVGVLPLRRVLFRADRVKAPNCAVPREPIAPADGWCDDPTHRMYNSMVTLPIDASAEELWRRDGVYDVIGVLGWNDDPAKRGRGSAIFLHVATPAFAPTAGCVALSLPELLAVLQAGLTEIEVLPG